MNSQQPRSSSDMTTPTGSNTTPDAAATGPQHKSGLPVAALTALVIGSMIGSGIFALPSQMAGAAAPGPLLIGWLITGLGMLMLAFVFQTLARRKPDIDGGVYGYARAGFGNYLGFTSAFGYWISAWIGNVAYLVLLFSTLGYFFPAFEGGNTPAAVAGASLLLWAVHFLTLRGVQNAAIVNTIVTIAKVVPLIVFLVIAAAGFDAGLFTSDFWGTHTDLGGTFTQVKAMMLITVWAFIGIEGASVYSQRARTRHDVGRATVTGFLSVLALLMLVNVLSYGVMARAKLAGLPDPSTAGVLKSQVGSWGAGFISIALIISVLGAFLAWVLLSVEILRLPAQDHNVPDILARENRHGAPSGALWATNLCVQAMLLWTLHNGSTYLSLILLASSLILLPYLWSAAYQVRLALLGRNEPSPTGSLAARSGKDLLIGIVALAYAFWLVYAGGLEYVLVAAIFYLGGTAAYVWARRSARLQIFTRTELIILAVVVALAIAGVIGMANGSISMS